MTGPAGDLKEFYSRISTKYTDLQRQSRFEVFFSNIPGTVLSSGDLSLKCESLDLPGRSFNTFDHRTYGPVIKYPTQSFSGDLVMTFFCTENKTGIRKTGMEEKRIFEDWMNYMNLYPNNGTQKIDVAYHNFKYKEEYARPIKVVCYSVSGSVTFEMTFHRAFPTMISPIVMSWNSEQVARVAVSFSYDYFTYSNQTEPSSNTGFVLQT